MGSSQSPILNPIDVVCSVSVDDFCGLKESPITLKMSGSFLRYRLGTFIVNPFLAHFFYNQPLYRYYSKDYVLIGGLSY